MGFYIRKSIKSSGVRFNFSKSGIGASVGVKGFRIGSNSRGNYIHMGRGGLYYRAAIGKKKNSRRSATSQSHSLRQTQRPVEPQVPQEDLHFQDIDSGDLAFIVDSSSQDVVNEINEKQKKFTFWPFAIVLAFIPGIGIPYAIIAAILLAAFVDKKRKTTVLVYDIDEDAEQGIQSFYNAFDELMDCSKAWHISSRASVHDKKYHAGVEQIVKRIAVNISYKTPKHLVTNVKVPAIPVGSQTIYFFPDRILIYDKKSVGGLTYGSFNVTQRSQRFIENGVVPRDGSVVDHTWQYVNKSGEPDKRFTNNPKLPILLYSEVLFTSISGLNELIQFSKQSVGANMITKLEQYKRSTFLNNGITPSQSSDVTTNHALTKPPVDFPSENDDEEHFAPIQPPQTNISSKYSSEKIVANPLAKGKSSEPYATFKKMKQAGRRHEDYLSYYSDDSETFCKQALFMKEFTDNYSEIMPLDTYYATYEKMNDNQLRTYFTWRTKVRQGVIESTSLSYAFCYIYELLNDVGVNNPVDTIEKLITLWTAFRQFNDKLDNHLRTWIRDYYITHKVQLPAEFSEYSCRFPVPYHDEDIELIEKAKSCSWDDLRVIEASSSFKITNGQFYKVGNQEIIEKCTCFIIRELSKVFKKSGVDFRKIFFEKRREKIYSLYQGAVHTYVNSTPITVELDTYETMKYNSRGWYREYVSITQYRPVVGYILKLIEVRLRQHFRYKRNLQVPNLSVVENSFINSEPKKINWPIRPTLDKLKAWKGKAFTVISSDDFEEAIVRAISDYCKAAHIVIQGSEVKVVKPVEIDMSKLKVIEREHIETAEKLIIEEPSNDILDLPISTSVPAAAKPELKEMTGLVGSLSAKSRKLLSTILEGEPIPSNSELLIETINEKALEAIDDNLIDYAESVPYVYDEYIDDLKSSLGGQ